MRKSIYLTRRHADFSHDRFVRRWRQHGALAMSKSLFDHMRAYVQAEIIQPAGLPGATQDYDAVAYIISRDREHSAAEIAELQEMVVDEHVTFFDAILPHLVQVEEQTVKSGPLGGFTAFLFFLDTAPAEQLAHSMAKGNAGRLILNLRVPGQEIAGLSAKIPYRAVVEVSTPELPALAGLIPDDHGADLLAATQECVMWDRLSQD